MKSLFASLVIAALTASPIVTMAEDGNEVAEEKTPPSEEVKKATKDAKPFDPQSYNCKEFMATLQGKGSEEMLGISIIWLHGHFSSTFGTDEMGALNEENIMEIAQDTAEFCEENLDMNFSRAAKQIYEEE